MGTCGFNDKYSDDEDNPRRKTDMDRRNPGKKKKPKKLKNITGVKSEDDLMKIVLEAEPPGRDSLMPAYHKGAEILCRFRPSNADEDGADQCVQYGDLDADHKIDNHWDLVNDDNEWDK